MSIVLTEDSLIVTLQPILTVRWTMQHQWYEAQFETTDSFWLFVESFARSDSEAQDRLRAVGEQTNALKKGFKGMLGRDIDRRVHGVSVMLIMTSLAVLFAYFAHP